MNVSLLLTVRKGSSFRDKSFSLINGKSCLDHILNEVKKSKLINSFYASSDCEKVIEKSKEYEFQPILRPSELAADDSKHIDVIKHSLKYISENERNKIEVLIVVLGNAPIIFNQWIDHSLNIIKNDHTFTSVVPVYEYSDHSPFRSKVICQEKGLLINPSFNTNNKVSSTNRQDLESTYFLCHNFWTINLKHWKNNKPPSGYAPWLFLGDKIKPMIIPYSHDIHNKNDVSICSLLMNWYEKNPDMKVIKDK